MKRKVNQVSSARVMAARIVKAFAVLVVCVAACFAVQGAIDVQGERMAREARGQFATAGQGDGAGDSGESVGSVDLGGSASSGGSEDVHPDPAFEQEALSLEGRDQVRIGASGEVVGYVDERPADQAFAELSETLQGKGWAFVAGETGAYGTFLKDEGTFTWLFVSATQTPLGSSVVIQCPALPAAR